MAECTGLSIVLVVAISLGESCLIKPNPKPFPSSPEEAIRWATKEKIMYVPCITLDNTPNYLTVVDVDRSSSTYSQVIFRLPMTYSGDELHHMGWNACPGSGLDSSARNKLIFPCLNSDRVYVVDVSNERRPTMHKVIEPSELYAYNVSSPHTSHCLPNGEVMISTMGAGASGNGRGQFILLDGKRDFDVSGLWSPTSTSYGYDYWYQPCFDVMVSSEWGAPREWKTGLNPANLVADYGHSIHIWSWSRRELLQTIDLGVDAGWLPLEVRFMHNPIQPHGYVATALSSNVFHIGMNAAGVWEANSVIVVAPITVVNWWVGLTSMPGVITDILISMDDNYLFFSNWVHGDIRMYDISNPASPVLKSQIWIGGSIIQGNGVVIEDTSLFRPNKLVVKGVEIQGGPQMLQLSLDGKRLYVTTSLCSVWDKQFYPELFAKGATMLQIDVDTTNGRMTLNHDFLVDYGAEPSGPVLAHQMRYPGGDCSSDVYYPDTRRNPQCFSN